MRKVFDHIKLVEEKQETLKKLFDQAHQDSFSIQSSAHQWKEIEEQLELAKISLLNHAKELNSQAEKIAEDSKALEEKDQEIELKLKEVESRLNDLEFGGGHISVIMKWTLDFSLELTLKERQLISTRKELESCSEMLRMKMGELELVQKEHEQCSKETSIKEKKLGDIEKSIEVKNQELKSHEEKMDSVRMKIEEYCNEISAKTKQLESVKESLEVLSKQLEAKKQELENAKSLAESCDFEIELKQTELTMKTNQLMNAERLIEEHLGELKSEEMKLLSVKEELKKCCQDLSLKTKQLESLTKEVEVKEKEVEKVNSSVENCQEEFERKQRELETMKSSISDCSCELELKRKQFETLQALIKVCSDELDLKAKKLSAIDNSVLECEKELNSKKKEFEGTRKKIQESAKELDMKQKQLTEINGKIGSLDVQLTSKQTELELIDKSVVDQSFYLRAHKPVYALTANEEEASQLILSDDSRDRDLVARDVLAKFVLTFLQESCSSHVKTAEGPVSSATKILLMERLIEFSPLVSEEVKTEAAKFAVSWKANLSSETEKSTEIWAFLLFLAAFRVFSDFDKDEILKLVGVVADRRNAPDICCFLGLTDKIPDLIEMLIERKQHKDAARFTAAFDLQHKFPLEQILQNCVDHIKGKAIDEEVSVLKSMLHCTPDKKLKNRYKSRIIELGKEKALCGEVSCLPAPIASVQLVEICSSKDQHNQDHRDDRLLQLECDRKRARKG